MTVTSERGSAAVIPRILLCTDQPAPLRQLLDGIDPPSELDAAETPAAAAQKLGQRAFDVCLIDVTWSDADCSDLAARIQSLQSATQLVRVATASETPGAAVCLPIDVIPRSSDASMLGKLVRSAALRARLQAENRMLRRQLQARVVNEILGQSDAASRLRESVRAAADADDCVLIAGGPGAGCQHVARVIHLASRRSMRPFLIIDCRVHSTESLEHELFGDAAPAVDSGGEEGAGRLAGCRGGTLFLKNIESLPLSAQKKLFGVLSPRDQGAGRGDQTSLEKMRSRDVRIIASTHADCAVLVGDGRFHAELYRRLSSALVNVPSLRDRIADVGLLAEQILNRLAVVEGKPVKRLSVEALKILSAHHWPGNVRELENVLERACTLDEGRLLTAEMLRPWISQPLSADGQEPSSLSLREMERKLIETTFARCRGNREQTARLLKIGIRTLSGKLREYGYPPRGGPDSKRGFSRAA